MGKPPIIISHFFSFQFPLRNELNRLYLVIWYNNLPFSASFSALSTTALLNDSSAASLWCLSIYQESSITAKWEVGVRRDNQRNLVNIRGEFYRFYEEMVSKTNLTKSQTLPTNYSMSETVLRNNINQAGQSRWKSPLNSALEKYCFKSICSYNKTWKGEGGILCHYMRNTEMASHEQCKWNKMQFSWHMTWKL